MQSRGNHNAAGVRERQETGGDVDPFSEDIVPLPYDLAEVLRYPDLHGGVMFVSSSLSTKFALHRERKLYGLQSTVECKQESIAGALDYLPAFRIIPNPCALNTSLSKDTPYAFRF